MGSERSVQDKKMSEICLVPSRLYCFACSQCRQQSKPKEVIQRSSFAQANQYRENEQREQGDRRVYVVGAEQRSSLGVKRRTPIDLAAGCANAALILTRQKRRGHLRIPERSTTRRASLKDQDPPWCTSRIRSPCGPRSAWSLTLRVR